MKLIDLLVQELPKLGGWPEGADWVEQSDVDRELYFTGNCNFTSGIHLPETASDRVSGIVTREQYEAALQQPVWDGEGLPPVGCECRFYSENRLNKAWPWKGLSNGDKVKIIHHFVTFDGGPTVAAFIYDMGDGKQVGQAVTYCFEPLKTQAERKREEAVCQLNNFVTLGKYTLDEEQASAIYDAIAAGKIPGVTLL